MYVIIYDFGTSSLKTCLFYIDAEIRLIASAAASYHLYILENGGAEQDTEEWWQAVCQTTKELFEQTDVTPSEVSGLAFCAQMQGVVLVDENGKALRRPMSYMDIMPAPPASRILSGNTSGWRIMNRRFFQRSVNGLT